MGVFNVENVENTWVTLLSHVSLIRPTNNTGRYGNLPLLSLLAPYHMILFFQVPVAIEF